MAHYLGPDFPDDPAAWYSFDAEDGTDDSGNGRTATVTSATAVAGISGRAFHFAAGDPEYVEANAAIDASTWDGVSVSFWVNRDTNGVPGDILRIGGTQTPLVDAGLFAYLYDNGLGFGLNTSGAESYYDFLITTDLQAGSWRHVCLTYDVATRQILGYLDGALVAATVSQAFWPGAPTEREPLPEALLPPSGEYYIGAYGDGLWATGCGAAVDEARIYNRVLSAAEAEVLADYPADPGTVEITDDIRNLASILGILLPNDTVEMGDRQTLLGVYRGIIPDEILDIDEYLRYLSFVTQGVVFTSHAPPDGRAPR